MPNIFPQTFTGKNIEQRINSKPGKYHCSYIINIGYAKLLVKIEEKVTAADENVFKAIDLSGPSTLKHQSNDADGKTQKNERDLFQEDTLFQRPSKQIIDKDNYYCKSNHHRLAQDAKDKNQD